MGSKLFWNQGFIISSRMSLTIKENLSSFGWGPANILSRSPWSPRDLMLATLHFNSLCCCVWTKCLWSWRWEGGTGVGWKKSVLENIKNWLIEQKKQQQRPSSFTAFFRYPYWGTPELQLRGSGRSSTSGLNRKKHVALCFEGLWTCLGDNNSPVDACLASTLLTLPPTFFAPHHLIYLHLLSYEHLSHSPPFFPLPSFILSFFSHRLPLWPIFLTQLRISFPTPVGEKRGSCYFCFSNDSGTSALICLGSQHEWAFFLGWLISSWGVY